MTREESIRHLEAAKLMLLGNDNQPISDLYYALEVAIEALKAEPCEDAISRQAVIDALTKTSGIRGDALKALYDLPPVNAQPKTGHWIFDDKCKEHGHCSECGYGSVDLVGGEPWNFCSNCGAKMVEPQETETWNGIHAQLTAPKGTFERIFNDADDENDI